jgi:hypothetical protein
MSDEEVQDPDPLNRPNGELINQMLESGIPVFFFSWTDPPATIVIAAGEAVSADLSKVISEWIDKNY